MPRCLRSRISAVQRASSSEGEEAGPLSWPYRAGGQRIGGPKSISTTVCVCVCVFRLVLDCDKFVDEHIDVLQRGGCPQGET